MSGSWSANGDSSASELTSANNAGARPRALVIAPHLDQADVGESFTACKLVVELSRHAALTVLAFECRYGPPLAQQLPLAEVVTFPEPRWVRRHERVAGMVKPGIPLFNRLARRWIRDALTAGRHFDIAHQILPRAPRYNSPLANFDLPYIFGSVGGALPTPNAFRGEVGSAPWFTRLRALDDFRFRHDPWL